MQKENLFGKTQDELKEVLLNHKLPDYSSKQIAEWIYKKKVFSFFEMTNLSKKTRELLGNYYTIHLESYSNVETSKDGTKKYLFHSGNNKYYETAYIPEKNRNTLCISVQVGCKMNCTFCMTAKQGFQANLTSGEIISQIYGIPERDKITNIVYMGMGEPLDNFSEVLKSYNILTSKYGFDYSPKKITISTIGIIPSIKAFIEKFNCNLAISIHNPFPDERKQIMPVEKKYPITEIVRLLKESNLDKKRRLTFEYIMFKDLNDTPRHVNQLSKLLHGLNCRINLIRFHSIPNIDIESSDEGTIQVFKENLNKKGIRTTIRASRGTDISAACGMLSTKECIKPV